MGDGVDFLNDLGASLDNRVATGVKDVTDAFKETASLEFESMSTKQKVAFKAFITNFSDAYTCNWESIEAQGRMDPIQAYSGTSRVVSLGWDVVAGSIEEARINLTACETLVQMLYPAYGAVRGGQAGIKAPPYFKFKFLNLAAKKGTSGDVSSSGLFGTAAGLTYSPNWEVGTFGSGKNIYPKVVSLAMDFTVLHDHQLGEVNTGFPYGATNGGQPNKTSSPPNNKPVATPQNSTAGTKQEGKNKKLGNPKK